MRISSAGALSLLLVACSQDAPGETLAAEADPRNVIECAIGGAASFERVCVVERTPQVGGAILTIRHPDGSFRNFAATYDDAEGPGGATDAFDTLDGAQRAVVTTTQDYTDVTVGNDRYRFPANADPRAER